MRFIIFILLLANLIFVAIADAETSSLAHAASCRRALYEDMIKRGSYSAPIPDCEENVKSLLRSGADPDQKLIESGTEIGTPLDIAATWGNADIAKLLLEAGAKTEARNNVNHTPLMTALWWLSIQDDHKKRKLPPYVQGEELPVIQVLLQYHADPNVQFEGFFEEDRDSNTVPYVNGYTPLTLAARHCWTAVAKALITAGADIKKPRNDGATPFELAEQYSCRSIMALLK